MRKWREANPEECKKRARDTYQRAKDKAKASRLLPVGQFTAAYHGARKRGLDFDIERKDFPVPLTCPVLGIPLDWETYNTTPSLDRIDNSKGYVPGNVIIVSRRANRLKDNATIAELQAIASFYGKYKNG